jgi:endonuclease/exonuclease/phosphatase (EEP) superfamily protein YafD
MNADERGSERVKSAFIRVHLRFELVLIFFVAGCHAAQKPETPTGAHFCVLTYNVNFGGPRPDLAVDAIKSSGADVVCLQETTPAWEEIIRTNLADTYAHISFQHGPAASGMAMLSKLPVRRTD